MMHATLLLERPGTLQNFRAMNPSQCRRDQMQKFSLQLDVRHRIFRVAQRIIDTLCQHAAIFQCDMHDERWPHVDKACRLSARSEEHTSELQSLAYLVCRLLLEQKNNIL